MLVLFEGSLHVHYGQAYVESDGEGFGGDMDATFCNQQNGLCGAGVAGSLFLITGLHTGRVAFRVELHEAEPPIDQGFEEIVEVSYRPLTAEVALMQWGGDGGCPLPLPETDYRVRYCGRRMDAGKEADTILDDEPTVDSYLLQFWPAPAAPDRIVKQTSETAAYWHNYASGREAASGQGA
jgi:hypothetical protein